MNSGEFRKSALRKLFKWRTRAAHSPVHSKPVYKRECLFSAPTCQIFDFYSLNSKFDLVRPHSGSRCNRKRSCFNVESDRSWTTTTSMRREHFRKKTGHPLEFEGMSGWSWKSQRKVSSSNCCDDVNKDLSNATEKGTQNFFVQQCGMQNSMRHLLCKRKSAREEQLAPNLTKLTS